MSGFIYEWVNKINGKKYIGSHAGDINDGYVASGPIFLRAIQKYGIENFERTILEVVDNNSKLKDREQYYLDRVDAANNRMYYNVKPVAGGGFECINTNPSLVAANTERCKWMTHLSPRFKGKKHTPESWKTTRDAWKDWADKNLKKPVLQFDLEMNLIQEHESISAAAKFVNGSPSNIKYTIEGTFATAYGYKWKYKEKQ
jgi:hypothetical protein